jgi:hypothetical protein
MGSSLGRHALRIAVKDRKTNRRMLGILSAVMATEGVRPRQAIAAACL